MILASLVLFTILGCSNPFPDQEILYPNGLGSYDEIRHYTFDPEMILTVLDQGRGEIFEPIPDYAKSYVFPPGSFAWQQKDYLKIVGALNQVASKETLEDWEIFLMIFARNCADNPVGFDDLRITYFKTDGDQYTTQEIDVYPLAKGAEWGGNASFPRPFLSGWKSVDLEKMKVTADDALQMAEANGGEKARLAAKNQCKILESLSFNLGKVY